MMGDRRELRWERTLALFSCNSLAIQKYFVLGFSRVAVSRSPSTAEQAQARPKTQASPGGMRPLFQKRG